MIENMDGQRSYYCACMFLLDLLVDEESMFRGDVTQYWYSETKFDKKGKKNVQLCQKKFIIITNNHKIN